MARLALTIFITLLSFVPLTGASAWTPIADRVAQSVVTVDAVTDSGEVTGFCSGWVINSDRKLVQTAAHCLSPKILVDGSPARVVNSNARKDLAVLRSSSVDKPALPLAAKDPDRGDQVASLGYGGALEQPLFRLAHISNVRLNIEGLSGPFIVLDAQLIGGQSGGPVVNLKGEVVMIVQRGGSGIGLGVGVDVIRDVHGRYYEERK